MVRLVNNLGIALALLAPGVVKAAALAPTQDFLYAIRVVESGDNYNCPTGPYGERGPYQFRRAVWQEYTSAPFYRARTAYADVVAERHYDWIVHVLSDRGLRPTVYNVAEAWNGGVGAVIRGRIPSATRGYASRVVNIVEEEAHVRAAETPRYRVAYAQ
jgi:hypothetical protein